MTDTIKILKDTFDSRSNTFQSPDSVRGLLGSIVGADKADEAAEMFLVEGGNFNLMLALLLASGFSIADATQKLEGAAVSVGFFVGYEFARQQYAANMADVGDTE